jgi:hypothetical protein
LWAPSGQVVEVTYATQDATAIAGQDYVASPGSLSLQPGETSRILAVPVASDLLTESDEQFTLVRSQPVNAAIGDGSATDTIRYDDPDQAPRSTSGDLHAPRDSRADGAL